MSSIAPYRFDLVDDPDNPLIRRSIVVGTRWSQTIVCLDLASGPPGAIVDPTHPDFDPDDFTPIPLGDFDGFRGKLRLSPYATGAALADLIVTLEGDPNDGTLTLELDVDSTILLQGKPRGFYDVEGYDNVAAPNQNVQRIMYGIWKTLPEVTRDDT